MLPLPLPPPPPSPYLQTPQEKHVRVRQARRRNPFVWCCALACLIFSILTVTSGVVALILFLSVKPRTPLFDVPSATLDALYFDSPDHINGELTLLANFTNPNRKLTLRFHPTALNLHFGGVLIATHAVQPFVQNPVETRLETIRLVSSLVYLPDHLPEQLQTQLRNYKVRYELRAKFRLTAALGPTRFSYRLHGSCQLELTGPPAGSLARRRCRMR